MTVTSRGQSGLQSDPEPRQSSVGRRPHSHSPQLNPHLAALDTAAASYVAAPSEGREGRRWLRERLICQALPFAARLARRYRGRGEPLEDLEQVARLALVRAVDRFDPERGSFSAYAAVTIIGELRRHFRDVAWGLHVPRRMQELSLDVGRASALLTRELGRTPTVSDLAGHLGTGQSQVLEAMEIAAAYTPMSLNTPARAGGGLALLDLIGYSDTALEAVDDRVTVGALLRRLPTRERQILALRFYGNRTQSEIAAELGISQMHVSRLLSRSLTWLREAILAESPPRWPGGEKSVPRTVDLVSEVVGGAGAERQPALT